MNNIDKQIRMWAESIDYDNVLKEVSDVDVDWSDDNMDDQDKKKEKLHNQIAWSVAKGIQEDKNKIFSLIEYALYITSHSKIQGYTPREYLKYFMSYSWNDELVDKLLRAYDTDSSIITRLDGKQMIQKLKDEDGVSDRREMDADEI